MGKQLGVNNNVCVIKIIKMAVREGGRSSRNFWGLVEQRGPWETVSSDRKRTGGYSADNRDVMRPYHVKAQKPPYLLSKIARRTVIDKPMLISNAGKAHVVGRTSQGIAMGKTIGTQTKEMGTSTDGWSVFDRGELPAESSPRERTESGEMTLKDSPEMGPSNPHDFQTMSEIGDQPEASAPVDGDPPDYSSDTEIGRLLQNPATDVESIQQPSVLNQVVRHVGGQVQRYIASNIGTLATQGTYTSLETVARQVLPARWSNLAVSTIRSHQDLNTQWQRIQRDLVTHGIRGITDIANPIIGQGVMSINEIIHRPTYTVGRHPVTRTAGTDPNYSDNFDFRDYIHNENGVGQRIRNLIQVLIHAMLIAGGAGGVHRSVVNSQRRLT